MPLVGLNEEAALIVKSQLQREHYFPRDFSVSKKKKTSAFGSKKS